MKAVRQTTLREQIAISGVGVHSGVPVTLTIHPADADTGIVFSRTDEQGREREVRADYRSVTATELATVLGDSSGILCSTAEHVLAALRGLGVDNALVELDGPEVPIMDGSAAPFVAAIDQVGLVSLNAPRRFIKVLKPVRVAKGEAFGELLPYASGFRLEIEINFDNPLIGRQTIATDLDPDSFRRELSRARTFGFMKDVSALWSAGKALGAGFENTVVMSESRVLNAEGLRPQAQPRRFDGPDVGPDGLDHGGSRAGPPYPRSCRRRHRSRGPGLRPGRLVRNPRVFAAYKPPVGLNRFAILPA
jgi:UDP-3-O-[3-hydroxymyristoyl] N-acetylglucosamine deacetylase